ncbi:hypothetical protein QR97_25945 [Streptomyces sp. PBH53]|nr:hypothetical protein QR97_25945 [Streptomyces sp. PBH53]
MSSSFSLRAPRPRRRRCRPAEWARRRPACRLADPARSPATASTGGCGGRLPQDADLVRGRLARR